MTQTSPTHDAPHWRGRAEEARRSAAEATDPEVRAALMEIARAYDRLAEITAKRKPGHA